MLDEGAKVIISEDSYFFAGETGTILSRYITKDGVDVCKVLLDNPAEWVEDKLIIRTEYLKKVD